MLHSALPILVLPYVLCMRVMYLGLYCCAVCVLHKSFAYLHPALPGRFSLVSPCTTLLGMCLDMSLPYLRPLPACTSSVCMHIEDHPSCHGRLLIYLYVYVLHDC